MLLAPAGVKGGLSHSGNVRPGSSSCSFTGIVALGFSCVATFTDRGSVALLLLATVAICSAVGCTVFSASFPEAIWLRPEDSCLMVLSSLLRKLFNLLTLIRCV